MLLWTIRLRSLAVIIRANKAPKDLRVPKGQEVRVVTKAIKATKVIKATKAIKVILANKVKEDQEAKLVREDIKERKVTKVNKVKEDQGEKLGLVGLSGCGKGRRTATSKKPRKRTWISF